MRRATIFKIHGEYQIKEIINQNLNIGCSESFKFLKHHGSKTYKHLKKIETCQESDTMEFYARSKCGVYTKHFLTLWASNYEEFYSKYELSLFNLTKLMSVNTLYKF